MRITNALTALLHSFLMIPPFLQFPVRSALCGASLCAAAVLLLQNVPACLRWLEEHELASCSQVQASVRFLRRVSDSVCLPALNQAELSLADSVSSLFDLPIGEGEPISLPQPLPAAPPPSVPTKDDVGSSPVTSHTAAPQPPPTVPKEVPAPNSRVSTAQPKVNAAGGDAEPEPASPPEGSFAVGHAKFSAIFAPPSFLRFPPKFPLLYPRDLSSIAAPRRSVVDIRASAPQGIAADPPEVSVSKPKVGSGSEQAKENSADAPAKPEAPPAAPPTLPEGETTPPMRCRILMLGDSLMEDLGPMTHSAMRHRKGLEFIVSAKYSTGLCRPDRFNWPAHLSEVISSYKPDLAIFFIGANDGMPIREGKRTVPLGTEAWRAAYAAKMSEMIDIARQAGIDVIWVELPSMSGEFSAHLDDTQQVQHSFCESHGIPILHTDLIFSGEEGRFEPYGNFHGTWTRLRTKDLVHLTKEGNQKLIDHLLPLLEQHLYAFYIAHPERRLSQEELAKIRRVPAVYTCQYVRPRPKKTGRSHATPHR